MSIVVDNEMLQDPAIVMTSKNPSLSSGSSRSRARYSVGMQFLKTALSSDSNHLQPIDSNPANNAASQTVRKSKRTPRKKKNKVSANTPDRVAQEHNASEQVVVTEMQQVQMQISTFTRDVSRGPENRSPNKRRRIFKPSNKQQNLTPKAPRNRSVGQDRAPLANTTNQETRVIPFNKQQVNHAPTFASSVTPFQPRRYPQNGAVYSQSRYSESSSSLSELNPFARSFIPQFSNSKPGASNEYVSREIFEYYQRNRQTNEQFKSKQIMRQGLESILKHGFPHHLINLYMVGSSTNGIGDNGSTVDICIIARKRPTLGYAGVALPAVVAESKPEPISSTATSTTNDGESEVQSSSSDQALPAPTSPIASPKAVDADVSASPKAIVEADGDSKLTDAASEQAQEALENLSLDKSNNDGDVVKEAQVTETDLTDKEDVAKSEISSEAVPELTLDMIEKFLQSKNFAKDIVSIPAKVPIIKFKDDITKLSITLNLNQEVSIRNTQLIRDYSKLDWRFPYLAMVMKQWARENHINNALEKTISNYSWTLMVVHFLQVCDPPVLPCLHKLMPRRYNQGNIEQAIYNWRRYPAKWRSSNNMNLRQLLKAMFRYYGYVFQYDQHVISVREGRVLERSDGFAVNEDHHSQWNAFLCIEEPFTRTNTARSVHDKDKFERIIELFRMSSNALRGVRISLFNVIADDINCPITY